MAQSAYGNVLLGVMLHGADRLRQGHVLTDVEQLLVDAVGAVVPEAEIRQWGAAYREVVAGGGGLAVVPKSVTGLPAEQGYTVEDLRQEMSRIIAAALAAPNVQVVDPFAAAAGEPEDPAFLDAMKEAKFGITAFAGPWEAFTPEDAAADGFGQTAGGAGDGGAGTADPSYGVKLEVESFFVHRAVGDQWGGRDEIFWTASTSAGGRGQIFHSEEFGAVETNNERFFSTGNKLLFEGRTNGGYLGTHITCWEKDQSTDAWWEALTKTLNDALKALNLLMQFDSFTGILPVWVGISHQVAGMLLVVIDAFRNYSDISSQRAIGMGWSELAELSRSGRTRWHFNGDGHHELRLKYTGEHVPYPSGSLEYTVRTGTTWAAPVRLPWSSLSSPALAAHAGRLYAAFVRPSDQAVMWASTDGNGNWSEPARIGGDLSYVGPALTSAHGKLIYAVTGKDGKIYFRTYTPSAGWTDPTQLAGSTQYSPTLATFSGRAWLATTGDASKIHHSIYNGSAWSAWRTDNLGWKTATHVAMAPGKADGHPRMWRVITATDDRVHTSVNGDTAGAGTNV
ncbi:hypothetical protein [Streptomyces goshikiensis]|uniref:hypothetical protein n=1 Tax=Streptomyces goshikiensis TaxID=1942 RepID=UPI003677FE89